MIRFFHDDIPVSIGWDDYRKEAMRNWGRLILGKRFVPPP